MRYILPCFLPEPIRAYHAALVAEIAARFDLPYTRRQAIPAHFTLKYHWETDDMAPVERLLEAFAGAYGAAPVAVGGFDHFAEDVVFVRVTLSPSAEALLRALFATLRTLPWMPWSPHDAEALRPHMTIAEGCRPRFAEVWRHLLARGRQFDAALDNLTVLRQVGEEDGITRWAVHRAFRLSVTAAGGRAPGTPATS
jgi:2'-5' RNA ligase